MPTVRDVISKKGSDVCKLGPDATAIEASRMMSSHRIGSVVVCEGEKVLGIFTERDLMNRVVSAGKDPASTTLRDVMSQRVACCAMETKLEECRTVMATNKIRHLPVVQDGRLQGIISSGDIMARALKDQQETIQFMQEYMQGPN